MNVFAKNTVRAATLVVSPLVCILTLCTSAFGQTALQTAVTYYNSEAAQLQAVYEDYVEAQQLGFEQYDALVAAHMAFIEADTPTEITSTLADYRAVQAALEADADDLDSAFQSFLLKLQSTHMALGNVLSQDDLNLTQDAYVTGSAHFTLTAHPFPFWQDVSKPSLSGQLQCSPRLP